jgi:biopolymer transport protein ExbB
MPLATGLLLLLLSIAVVTVSLDRGRWWLQWWRRRAQRRRHWRELRSLSGPIARQIEDWDQAMRFGEPLLQAAAVLAPLLGLTGTVLGLIRVLAALGPDLTLPVGTTLQGYGQVLISTALGLVVSLVASASLFANQGLRSWQIGRLQRAVRRRDGGMAP